MRKPLRIRLRRRPPLCTQAGILWISVDIHGSKIHGYPWIFSMDTQTQLLLFSSSCTSPPSSGHLRHGSRARIHAPAPRGGGATSSGAHPAAPRPLAHRPSTSTTRTRAKGGALAHPATGGKRGAPQAWLTSARVARGRCLSAAELRLALATKAPAHLPPSRNRSSRRMNTLISCACA